MGSAGRWPAFTGEFGTVPSKLGTHQSNSPSNNENAAHWAAFSYVEPGSRSDQRSTIATTPMPPAVQIDTSARPPPRSASCLAAVAITRAPVAANG